MTLRSTGSAAVVTKVEESNCCAVSARTMFSFSLNNIRKHYAEEARAGGYVPYNIAALTGAWNIVSRLFFLDKRPLRLRDEFSRRVKIYGLRGDTDDPIRFYRHYGYRAKAMHWSERQLHERLFVPAGERFHGVAASPARAIAQTVGQVCLEQPATPSPDRSISAMPSSATFGKPFIYFFVKELARRVAPLPMRFLDVGAGLATYPKMFKSVLDGCRFTGIEVWSPYIEQFDLNYWYDEVIIADVRYLDWKKVPSFDMAFFGDVLEHMTRTDAAAAVRGAADRCGCVITSIPLGYHPQTNELGNPWERHISENWNIDEIPIVFRDVIGTHTHSFIGVSVVCTSPAFRKPVMESYVAATDLVKDSADKIKELDQFDYRSLRAVLDDIENDESCPL